MIEIALKDIARLKLEQIERHGLTASLGLGDSFAFLFRSRPGGGGENKGYSEGPETEERFS
jgi:hypothetical protein